MAVITAGASTEQNQSRTAALKPLAIDVAVPLAAYYLAHSALGLGLVASLTVSSAVPAVRSVVALVRDRSVNALALLMLTVNVAGIALSAVAGDPRLMIAKDAVLSSVIGGSMLLSALLGRPLMTAGMRPFIVKGSAARAAAWDRLAAGDRLFARRERTFTLIWGGALFTECVVKAVCAYTLPVETMVWFGTVLLMGAIAVGIMAGGAVAGRMAEQVIAEAE